MHGKWAGNDYFFAPFGLPVAPDCQTTFLLPDYDEYGMTYKSRSVLINPAVQSATTTPAVPDHWLIVDGMIGGSWQRTAGN
ncbi:DNA glycosylase AlkZ-like family protein [Spirosoma areae]